MAIKAPQLFYWLLLHSRKQNHRQLCMGSRVEDGRGSTKPRFPSPLIKPDMRSYRIRLSDWILLKAHAGQQVLSTLAASHQVLQTRVQMDTEGCLANAPYAVVPENA